MQNDSMELSITQQFEIEKMNRIIDNATDIEALKQVTKQLMKAWQLQKSASLWAYRQTLTSPPKIKPACLLEDA
jgi:hypothetical protein